MLVRYGRAGKFVIRNIKAELLDSKTVILPHACTHKHTLDREVGKRVAEGEDYRSYVNMVSTGHMNTVGRKCWLGKKQVTSNCSAAMPFLESSLRPPVFFSWSVMLHNEDVDV